MMKGEAVTIASEPLTDADWELVPRNHIIAASPPLHINIHPW